MASVKRFSGRLATGKGHNQEARAAPPNNGNNNEVLPTRNAVLEKAKMAMDKSVVVAATGKIKATLNVGSHDDDIGGKSVVRRHGINENVSNFISHVRMKRRTKSSGRWW
ncbi:hypothetical protein U1Q18_034176 [Sarracenia purpurea var. burkii]